MTQDTTKLIDMDQMPVGHRDITDNDPGPAVLPKCSHYISTIDLVRQFHVKFEHPVAKELTASDVNLRRLRVKLLAEELGELCQALGVPMTLEVTLAREGDDPKSVMNGMRRGTWLAPAALCYADEFVDMVETADALADIDYVTQGANLVFGVPAGLVMYEVHSSNMSKLGADGKPVKDADGKIMKGPYFRKPDIKTVLDTFDPAAEL